MKERGSERGDDGGEREKEEEEGGRHTSPQTKGFPIPGTRKVFEDEKRLCFLGPPGCVGRCFVQPMRTTTKPVRALKL